jgi:ABC-type transporter Mla subunit MlaD
MNGEKDSDLRQLESELPSLTAEIQTLAHRHRGNSRALLALLRALEQTHRDIHEDLFQTSLPSNRQELYALLRDIEESGGWPYIERMRLRSLLSHLPDFGLQPAETNIEE